MKMMKMIQIQIPKKLLTLGDNNTAVLSDGVVGYIKYRAQRGRGVGNRPWNYSGREYSDSYKNSKNFMKKTDKSGVVNLKLTGKMLKEIKLIRYSDNELFISIPSQSPEYKKAMGNITGSYGGNKPDSSKAINFFKFDQTDISNVLRDIGRVLESNFKTQIQPKDFVKGA